MSASFPQADQPAHQILPYSAASPAQQQEALTRTYQEQQPRFPEIWPHHWKKAFARCQPTLWVEDNQVWVEDKSLTRLLTYLTGTYTSAGEHEPAADGALIYHLAKKLNYISHASAQGVAYWATQPLADAFAGQRALLLSFASEDVIASQVQEAFALPRSNSSIAARAIAKGSISQEKARKKPAPRKGPVLREHWRHLQKWLEEQQQPLRPWNIAAIGRTLEMSQSMVNRLLFEPQPYLEEGPGIFTRRRLSRAQRLFASYGYFPPL